jgi:hypothetical protein
MMRINRPFPTLLLVVLLVMTMPRPAAADDHKADWSGGFSGAFASRLFGARTTLAFNPKRDRTFSIVADLSVHHGKHDNETITRTTNLYGVRLLAFSSADGAVAKHAVSVQLLMGVLSPGSGDDKEAAGAFGFVYDYMPNDGGLGFRGQVDYVLPQHTAAFARVSTGVVYRFGRQ